MAIPIQSEGTRKLILHYAPLLGFYNLLIAQIRAFIIYSMQNWQVTKINATDRRVEADSTDILQSIYSQPFQITIICIIALQVIASSAYLFGIKGKSRTLVRSYYAFLVLDFLGSAFAFLMISGSISFSSFSYLHQAGGFYKVLFFLIAFGISLIHTAVVAIYYAGLFGIVYAVDLCLAEPKCSTSDRQEGGRIGVYDYIIA